MKVEHVSARQLLWPVAPIVVVGIRRSWLSRLRRWGCHHFLSADDTDAVSGSNVLGCRVRISGVHVGCRPSVPHEIPNSLDKRAKSEIEVANNVEWNSIKMNDECKEDEVGDEFAEVWNKGWKWASAYVVPGCHLKVIKNSPTTRSR